VYGSLDLEHDLKLRIGKSLFNYSSITPLMLSHI